MGMSSKARENEAGANRAARRHMGDVAWPTVALFVFCLVGYVSALALTALGIVGPVSGFLATAFLVYLSYTIVHEAVHGSIHGSEKSLKWASDAMGYICAQFFGLAFTIHRKEHLAHHRNTNAHGEDPDLALVTGGLIGLLRGALIALPMQVKYYLDNHWATASKREKAIIFAEYSVMISWRIGFIAVAGWKVSLLLLLGATLLGILMLLLSFAWIVHRSFDVTGRYKDTSTIIFPEPFDTVISWLWLFQNYHSIHHLFPRVPFYRYRRLFREIEEIMVANGAPILRIAHGRKRGLMPSINPA
ncbi:MAG: fatty acid desaturase [Pseudomonadota bacterium]